MPADAPDPGHRHMTRAGATLDWAALDGVARRWLARRAPAGQLDDLTQETLLRVHRTIPADVRSARAWTLRTAHSVLVDHFRAVTRRTDVATDPGVLAALTPLSADDVADRPGAGLDAEADRALDAAIVRCLGGALRALPPEQLEALTMTGPAALTQSQAAERAGITVPGMKARVQRGREAVRGASESCCAFELDGRGRPIGMQPRTGRRCTCGCVD